MPSLRLQRAQFDLQAHRIWLDRFIVARQTSLNQAKVTSPSARTFATAAGREHQPTPARSRTVWQKKKSPKAASADRVNLQVLSARDDLAKAIEAFDITAIIACYNNLPSKKSLSPKDVGALAQCVHQCLRLVLYKPAATRKREDVDDIVSFAKQLVKDIRKERILPSISAHIHLLGVFKESGTRDAGVDFWQWLENQDHERVNLDVYAVAIDLLAINGSSLDELEDMYQSALSRFPGTFFAYHLAPRAILPDREQEVNIKGLPMSLLKSITLARLLRGDSQKAYLGLDTAFRLFPTSVPQRFFNLFQDERPVSESFTVFAMACRAGIQIPSGLFRGLLAKLRTCSGLETATSHIVTLRVLLAALYLQLGSSGTLTSNSVSELIITLTQVFRLPGVAGIDQSERKKVVDAVLGAIRQIMAVFVRYSALPTISAFNSIITNIAGYGRAKEVLSIASADMKALNLRPNEVTRRSLLTTAGLLKDPALVNKFWKDVEDAHKEQQSTPDASDLHVLVKAARLAGQDKLARTAWDTYKQYVSAEHVESIERYFEQPLDELEPARGTGDVSANNILEGIAAFQADLIYVDEHTKDQPAVQDYGSQDVPITLLPPKSYWDIPEIEMRRLYDDLTSEPPSTVIMRPSEDQDENTSLRQAERPPDLSHSPELPGSTKSSSTPVSVPKFSVTNIPFGQLRYENWKAFNYLLRLAEQHDQDYEKAVDQAIAAGAKPPARNLGFTRDEIDAMKDFGLSTKSEAAGKEGGGTGLVSLVNARADILRLRGLRS